MNEHQRCRSREGNGVRLAIPVINRRSAVIASTLVWVLMVFLFGQDGTIASAAPIILLGTFFGPRWGVIAGLVSYPANAIVVWLALGSPMPFLNSSGAVLGTIAAVIIGGMIGHSGMKRYQAESLFGDAFKYAPIGMAIVSPTGVFERVNPAFAEMLHRSSDELVGLNWRDITPEGLHEENKASAAGLYDGTMDKIRFERTLIADGQERLAMVHLSAVRSPDGQPTHVLAQMEDVTDIARTNSKLRQLLESKDRFLSSISHELRTPLSAVLGLSSELRDSPGDFSRSEISELAGLVAQQSAELAGLVEDFLVHARADTGQIRVNREPVDLVAETERVLRVMQPSELAQMRLISDHEAVVAIGDGLRVRQIIRNLVQNAHRYGGPTIGIEVRHLDGQSTLTVTDDGDGVEEGSRDAIFEPYERSHENTGLTESLGVGLYVSRTLARLMGGDITYHREGGNTHFVFTLPGVKYTEPAVPSDRSLAQFSQLQSL